ncbi:MAG: hypothetical protein IKL66_04995 [Clostridia bacterium]|nr:hypothetical protein [Clostridia bacterium]
MAKKRKKRNKNVQNAKNINTKKESKIKISKKAVIATLIAIVCVACAVAIGIGIFNHYQRKKYEVDKYEVNFAANETSFVSVANRVLSYYNSEKLKNEDLECITITSPPDLNWKLICKTTDGKSYSVPQYASANDKTVYGYIVAAFAETQNKDLMTIKVTEDRIIFGGRPFYSIVYMKDGSKPDYVLFENENYSSIFVEEIADGWYQVIGKK